jgi:hypothetical protein
MCRVRVMTRRTPVVFGKRGVRGLRAVDAGPTPTMRLPNRESAPDGGRPDRHVIRDYV